MNEYKFTNAYRASDRVSQYLIRRVIYEGDQKPEQVLFRILLFKLFNKIETWELLKSQTGDIRLTDKAFSAYERVLSRAQDSGRTLYSGAYIMPPGSGIYSAERKHQAHLKLLHHLTRGRVVNAILNSKNMNDLFSVLRDQPLIGDFLAYQFGTDINYSAVTDFSEMDFTVPGPGAKSGIKKCFDSLGDFTEADLIRHVTDSQEDSFRALGIQFRNLWGRSLQLIDCQNLFCEVDKYTRVFLPHLAGKGGRTRIKQRFRPSARPLEYSYPPKWKLRIKKTAAPMQGDLWNPAI